ncbi:MAG: pseudaminic acid cytidylyltransferase, partial [Bacteroidales bacterium]|nr:pseudaminic acid cytidylyltransferase [Bacteroidales bacterium]
MKNIAIIPARGGSKRIPLKNVKAFLGKPILAYSIETALQSNLFEEVMVSTDDEQIAEIAVQYGAKVPFLRSDKTANDYADIAAVIIEVLGAYQERNLSFDAICCLLATAPLIQADDLKNTYK